MTEWNVAINGHGRAGTIIYSEGSNSVQFDWELGARDVVAIITGPPPQNWSVESKWANGRRREILQRVAREVIRLQAPGSTAELTDGDTTILLRKST
jgi:hypothetical protein